MDSVKEELFRRMPDGTKPIISQGYHIVSPTASWRKYRRRENTRRHVAERFFDGWDHFKQLEAEFFEESGIVDIVVDAIEEIGDEKVVFDTHRGVCARVYSLIRERKPDAIVASGVFSGVATSSMLLALEANDHGTLYSVDRSSEIAFDDRGSTDPENRTAIELDFFERGRPSCSEGRSHQLPDDKEPGWLVPSKLRDRWEFQPGHGREELLSLPTEVPEIELYYHDSVHSTAGMLFEFDLAWEWLAPGGLLVTPHADRNDAFDIFVDEHDCEHGLLEYDYLAYDEYDTPCSCAYAIKPPV